MCANTVLRLIRSAHSLGRLETFERNLIRANSYALEIYSVPDITKTATRCGHSMTEQWSIRLAVAKWLASRALRPTRPFAVCLRDTLSSCDQNQVAFPLDN